MTHSNGGKGSARRPGAGYGDGYDRIFGKRDELPITMESDEDDEDDALDYCDACSGSGEGMYDGSSCYKCKGTGNA